MHQDAPTLLEDLAASEQPKLRGMLGKHKLKNSQSHGLNTISFEESPSLSFAAVHFSAQICPDLPSSAQQPSWPLVQRWFSWAKHDSVPGGFNDPNGLKKHG